MSELHPLILLDRLWSALLPLGPLVSPDPHRLKQVRPRFYFARGLLIAMMMEAASTFVNFYQTTRCYNPEDRYLHTRRFVNLKSYTKRSIYFFLAVHIFVQDPIVCVIFLETSVSKFRTSFSFS
jgi:hypothetical protein